MSKRPAERQLTKEEVERSDFEESNGASRSEQLNTDTAASPAPSSHDTTTKRPRFIPKSSAPMSEHNSAALAAALPKFDFGAVKAPVTDAFAHLRPPADSWECAVCLVVNTAAQGACASCQTPRPGHEAAAATTASVSASTAAPAGITFGVVAGGGGADNGVAVGAPSFTSGWGSGTSTPFTFTFGGATANSASPFSLPAIPPIVFGAATATENNANTFSSGDKLIAAPPQSDGDTSTQSAPAASAPVSLTTTTTLTGEEDDAIVMRAMSKVFFLKRVAKVQATATVPTDDEPAQPLSSAEESSADGEVEQKWVEQGVGELHVNTYQTSAGAPAARLILRAERTHRLVLNAPLLSRFSSTVTIMGERYVRLSTVDETRQLVHVLLKFKSRDVAQQAHNAIVAATNKKNTDDSNGHGDGAETRE